jgi:pimeloyl-ACP methyl ester carboxylesterase
MLGGDPHDLADHARAAAASERLPLGVPQVLVLGDHDDVVPQPIAEAYVRKARAAGDRARLLLVPGAGHFEIAATTTPAWTQVRSAILALLQMDRPQPAAPKVR